MKRLIVSILMMVLFVPLVSLGQTNIKDSALMIPMLRVSYGFSWPGGDLKDRFGGNSNIDGGFSVKLKNNWLLGIDYNYLFGSKVKNGDSLFSNIATEDGYLINSSGELDYPVLYERGYNVTFSFGKIIPVWSPNRNSGPFVTLGGGYFQHKIRIEDQANDIPQIAGDYKKGYDRLTSGISVNECIGYMFFGNHRLVSFYGGLEFTQAFTQSRRTYDFNQGGYDGKSRVDLLYGFKIGWIIPFYKRKPAGYYYD